MIGKWQRWLRRAAWGAGAVAALGCAWEAWLRWGPFPEEHLQRWDAGVVVTDRDGRPMRVRLNSEGQDCRPTYRADAGDWIVQALVAAEDQRFWRHGGVDWIAMGRAVLQNVASGRRISGASTLSTQVIRLSEPRARVVRTKLIEAARAMQMERRHDKLEIVSQWLNRAPFGGNIVGIEAAAQRYFGKAAKELDVAEAAMLAGVPQSPSRLRPDRHFDRARRRQAYVLGRMRALGMIDAKGEARALEERLDVHPATYPEGAPHFCDWVLATCRPAADGSLRSTLDPAAQEAAERALRARLGEADADGLTGAVVVLENATGAVRAMVGSPDFRALPAGQYNGALAARSAGSTLKPFVYAMAFDRGWLTGGSVVADEAMHFSDLDPRNFDGTFSGRTTVREALAESLNLPAVGVARKVGLRRVAATLRGLGLGTLRHGAERYGVGLALGNGEVRLLDLANAYACLARGGTWRPVAAVDAEAEAGRGGDGKRVFSEEACWMVADALSGEERSMDFAGHAGESGSGGRVAWKTGTSAGLRDAWCVAWNPEWTVGAWVGRADGKGRASLVGRTMAVPVAAGV
ncbi:MAG: penicillin-binding protein 1C, partial [Kiritimatiellae bacterium]|nr:penicillin-binding protein 1C [Kiritimatiellia bacterium]